MNFSNQKSTFQGPQKYVFGPRREDFWFKKFNFLGGQLVKYGLIQQEIRGKLPKKGYFLDRKSRKWLEIWDEKCKSFRPIRPIFGSKNPFLSGKN